MAIERRIQDIEQRAERTHPPRDNSPDLTLLDNDELRWIRDTLAQQTGPKIDLKQLTTEELERLENLLIKATPQHKDIESDDE